MNELLNDVQKENRTKNQQKQGAGKDLKIHKIQQHVTGLEHSSKSCKN